MAAVEWNHVLALINGFEFGDDEEAKASKSVVPFFKNCSTERDY